MANSTKFYALSKRLRELRRHFLPKTFSPTGDYTTRQRDLAKAYKLLAHAEIEYFLEEISKSTIVSKVRRWKDNRKASDTIICLLTYYHSGWSDKEGDELIELLSSMSTEAKPFDSSEAVIDNAVRQYMGKILTNNGVKQADLKKIVLPLGIRLEDLDNTWLIALDSFGSSRGEIAHKTSSVTTEINPQDEYTLVTEIGTGLKRLDEMILSLK